MGEAGITAAEQYIAEQFDAAGLNPLPGTDGFFLDFEVTRTEFATDGLTLQSMIPAAPYAGSPGHDFRPLPFSQDADVAGELVFAGYGIQAPSFGHDDYDGLNVHGRIVLVIRGEPDTADPNSPFFGEGSTNHAYFKTKAEVAYRRGAVGMIVVNPVGRPERPTDFEIFPSFELDSSGRPVPMDLTAQVGDRFPAILSSSAFLQWASDQWGVRPTQIVSRMNDGIPPGSLGLDTLSVRVQSRRRAPVRGIPARNVAGILPGDDEAGIIIIGAHHDHLGTMVGEASAAGADTIFNGADDNASGVAVVLEAARQLAGANPRKRILFVTFSGEEQGLLGSAAFASSGIMNLSGVDLMINVDMAGRNSTNPVLVYHSGSPALGGATLESIAASVALRSTIVTSGVGGSDFIPFEESGIPVVFPFSGLHDDYHGVDDEADRLDYQRMTTVTEFVVGIVLAAAGE
jgi:Peptidase family M28/PA domain